MWNPKLFFPLFLFICGGVGASENSIFEHSPVLNDFGEGLNNWMSFVEDGQKINKISIPGTHDTMSNGKHCRGKAPDCHKDWVNDGGQYILFDYVQTQDLSLKTQLEMGIRYLDIRLRHYGDAFTIHHGPVYLFYNFDDVLGTVTSFLKKHDRETIIISYQEEHTAIPGGKSFAEVFNDYVNKTAYKQYIYGSTDQTVYNNVPTLKTVRGMIVFYNKEGDGTLGLRSAQMKDRDSNIDVKTDAYYDELETHIKKAMKSHNDASEKNLWITFLSANNGWQVGKGPREIAWFVNPQMEYRLRRLKDRTGSFGIVVMDYPSIDLIRVILKKNVMNGYFALLERILVPKTDRKYCAIHQGAGKEKFFHITLNGGQHQTKDPSSNQFKFAYVWIQEDCELTIYSDKSYQGYHQKIEYGSSWLTSSHWLGWWWQNDVRSYKCHCATYGRFNIH